MYDWVLSWADSPHGAQALLVLAFAEASFFPIPPDLLLIALALGRPGRALRFASICTLGSVLGGIAGYGIGYAAFEALGRPVLALYGLLDRYEQVQELFVAHQVWIIGVAGFTPVPYKVFTIAAGAAKIHFGVFLFISAVSRGARFFLVSGLIWRFGPRIKGFIDRSFNLLTILFLALLIGGFLLLRLFV